MLYNILPHAYDRTDLSTFKAKYVWFKGDMVPWEEAKIHVLTHAFNYGSAAFEGIRAYASGDEMLIFRLRDHLSRLFKSCKLYGIEIPFSFEEIHTACVRIVGVNEFHEPVYIRPIVYVAGVGIGIGFLGHPVEVTIAAVPFSGYFGGARGIDAMVSSWRKPPEQSLPPMAKITGHYSNSVLAKMEALKNGYGEAILLDINGRVSEGTAENIFLVRNGVLSTPPVSNGILEGITRDTVIKIARDEGIEVQEREIARSELYTCDEAFFVGTAAEVTYLKSVDRKMIGDGNQGQITKRIATLYQRAVMGKLSGHEDWVTPVYSTDSRRTKKEKLEEVSRG